MSDLPRPDGCAHCSYPPTGVARIWRDGTSRVLCHPDIGLDCYDLVTVWGHTMPCMRRDCLIRSADRQLLGRIDGATLIRRLRDEFGP